MYFKGSARKKDAEKALREQRPCLVLFFKEGCPFCEQNQPAWDQVKERVDPSVTILEIDAEATPDSSGVSGFPTMKFLEEGKDEKSEEGAQPNGDEIAKKLKVPTKKKLGGRRRHTRRRPSHRRQRKLRHRTLRNNVALV